MKFKLYVYVVWNRQERLKKARMAATTDVPETTASENDEVPAVEIELLNDLALVNLYA